MNNITFMIPAYNSAVYLSAAIESIQKAFECECDRIIVVDDGSSDNTSGVAKGLGVRCIRHPSNRGIASGLNTAVAAASTEYVAWLSSDDLYTEHAGTVVTRYMKQFPHADFYFGEYKEIDSTGRVSPVDVRHPLGWDVDGLIPHDWLVDLILGCFINGSTVVLKRQAVIDLGLFDTGIRYSQDYAMWLLMTYHRCSAVYMKDIVGFRRVHQGQLSHSSAVRKAIVRENGQIISRYLNDGTFSLINDRLCKLPGDPDAYRVILAKRLLALKLYKEAHRVIKDCRRPYSVLGTVVSDALKFTGRRLGLLPKKGLVE